MSTGKFRQSILTRPRKAKSISTLENADLEYEKERQRYEAVSQRLQGAEQAMLKSIFPNSEEKVQLQEQIRSEMDRQMAIREEIRKAELLQDLEHAAQLQQHVQLTQYVEADHKSARREYLRHLMEQNQRLMEYRETLAVQSKTVEVEEDKNRPDFSLRWNTSTR